MKRHRALEYCLSMGFSEHRSALFRIMLWAAAPAIHYQFSAKQRPQPVAPPRID